MNSVLNCAPKAINSLDTSYIDQKVTFCTTGDPFCTSGGDQVQRKSLVPLSKKWRSNKVVHRKIQEISNSIPEDGGDDPFDTSAIDDQVAPTWNPVEVDPFDTSHVDQVLTAPQDRKCTR